MDLLFLALHIIVGSLIGSIISYFIIKKGGGK